MTMSESELADYLDELITRKIEKHEDVYTYIRNYFRILQLQLNHIKARADLGKYFFIAMCRRMNKKDRNALIQEVEKLKIEDDEKIMKEIEEGV